MARSAGISTFCPCYVIYYFTDESVKRQISENLTDSDLESNMIRICRHAFNPFDVFYDRIS